MHYDYRQYGMGELYAYLPLTEENTVQLLAVPPKSIKNPDYGISAGRGAFTFKAGEWTTITERIKLNDIGSCNGRSYLFCIIYDMSFIVRSV